MVSEGLAGRFVEELYGDPPEPWEDAAPQGLAEHTAAAARSWDRADYGHAGWFFGEGDRPRWLGYSLGYRRVGAFLSANPGAWPSALATEPAASFRAALEGLR